MCSHALHIRAEAKLRDFFDLGAGPGSPPNNEQHNGRRSNGSLGRGDHAYRGCGWLSACADSCEFVKRLEEPPRQGHAALGRRQLPHPPRRNPPLRHCAAQHPANPRTSQHPGVRLASPGSRVGRGRREPAALGASRRWRVAALMRLAALRTALPLATSWKS